MNTAMFQFDTHAFVSRLKKAGATEPLAEAIVDGLSQASTGQLATKQDVADLKQGLSGLRADMTSLVYKVVLAHSALTAGLVVALLRLLS